MKVFGRVYLYISAAHQGRNCHNFQDSPGPHLNYYRLTYMSSTKMYFFKTYCIYLHEKLIGYGRHVGTSAD